MKNWPNPFIEQRADPYILRHQDSYYFIASVPEYDRLEIRRSATLEGLRDAQPVVVWRKPDNGPMSQPYGPRSCIKLTANGISTLPPATRTIWMRWVCSSTACSRWNARTATR